MSRNPDRETAPMPWSHPVQVASLDQDEPAVLKLEPDEGQRAAIAAFLGIEALERLSLDVTLAPIAGGWSAEGVLSAAVVQSCVVTLEPVYAEIEAEVARRFLRDLPAAPRAEEVELVAEDLDGPEPLGAAIDVGQIAVETLALALDPWPRAEGAKLGPKHFAAPGLAPMTDEDARPFAGLRVLKGGLDSGDGSGGP